MWKDVFERIHIKAVDACFCIVTNVIKNYDKENKKYVKYFKINDLSSSKPSSLEWFKRLSPWKHHHLNSCRDRTQIQKYNSAYTWRQEYTCMHSGAATLWTMGTEYNYAYAPRCCHLVDIFCLNHLWYLSMNISSIFLHVLLIDKIFVPTWEIIIHL